MSEIVEDALEEAGGYIQNRVEVVENAYEDGEGIEEIVEYSNQTGENVETIVTNYIRGLTGSDIVADALDPEKGRKAAEDLEKLAESFEIELTQEFYTAKRELEENL